MKNDNTETTEPGTVNESELETVKGGAAINLDAFITVLNADRLRNMVGLDRPKGLTLATNLGDLSTNLRTFRGV